MSPFLQGAAHGASKLLNVAIVSESTLLLRYLKEYKDEFLFELRSYHTILQLEFFSFFLDHHDSTVITKVEIDLNSESRNLSKQDGLFPAVKTFVMEELHP